MFQKTYVNISLMLLILFAFLTGCIQESTLNTSLVIVKTNSARKFSVDSDGDIAWILDGKLVGKESKFTFEGSKRPAQHLLIAVEKNGSNALNGIKYEFRKEISSTNKSEEVIFKDIDAYEKHDCSGTDFITDFKAWKIIVDSTPTRSIITDAGTANNTVTVSLSEADMDILAAADMNFSKLAGNYNFTHWNLIGPQGNQLSSTNALVAMVFTAPWTGSIVIDTSGMVDGGVNVPEVKEQFADMFAGFPLDELPMDISGQIIEMDDNTVTIESDTCETGTDTLEYSLSGNQLVITVPYDFCQTEPSPELEGSIFSLYFEK